MVISPGFPEEVDKTYALTLNDCYKMALTSGENISAQTERILQFEQRYREALGNIFPRINFQFNEKLQDTSGIPPMEGGFATTFVRRDTPEAKFVLRQTLFSGFMEYAGLASLKAEIERERFIKKDLERKIYLDVARAFYTVILLEKKMKNLQEMLSLFQDRYRELEKRVRLGKSRKSELLSVESQILSLQAQQEALAGDINSARELLMFFIGSHQVPFVLVDELPEIDEAPSEEELMSKLNLKPDILAMREDVESRRFSLKMAKRSLLPTVSLMADYYVQRVGFQEPIDWDIFLTLDVPIFQGGSGVAGVNYASHRLKEAEFNHRYYIKQRETEIKRKLWELKGAIASKKVLRESYHKAEEVYKLNVNEYRLGLVNNLEVLQAMNSMLESKTNLDIASVETRLLYIELMSLAGAVP